MDPKSVWNGMLRMSVRICLITGLAASASSSAQQQDEALPEEVQLTEEQRLLMKFLEDQRQFERSVRQGESLDAEQASNLESTLIKDPSDMEARAGLLGYYFSRASDSLGNEGKIQGRRRHILWLIENHPSSKLLLMMPAVKIDEKGHPLADPQGYAQARKLWLQQTAKQDVTAAVLANAGSFFLGPDNALSAELFGRARKLDPKFPLLTEFQGSALAFALTGITLTNQNGLPARVDPELINSDSAKNIRAELEKSEDVDLLLAVASQLSSRGVIARFLGSTFDASGFVEYLLNRARGLPGGDRLPAISMPGAQISQYKSTVAKSQEESAASKRARYQQLEAALGDARPTDNPGRAGQFLDLARAAMDAGEENRASEIADQLLMLVPKLKENPVGASLVDTLRHHGHLILGRAALRRGDLDGAKSHPLEAGRVDGGGTLSSFGPNMTLAKELLERGEKSVVLEYFELCRKFWKFSDRFIPSWTESVKRGEIPNFGPNLLY